MEVMNKIEILEDANEFFFESRYCIPVKYDNREFMIVVVDSTKYGERTLYHFDKDKRYGIGDEYDGDDYEELYEILVENTWELGLDTKKGNIIDVD